MTKIALKFTRRELELLSTLVSDQLFRREFIDSRLPGHRLNSEELSLGKQLVERLKIGTGQAPRTPTLRKNGAAV